MSFCRFSSDNFGCDLYVYESCHGGYVTHVAGNRVVGVVPDASFPYPMPDSEDERAAAFEDWSLRHRAQMAFLADAEREPIGLPCDGESFMDDDLEALRARLLMLREVGYRFPDYVIKAIDEEIADEQIR